MGEKETRKISENDEEINNDKRKSKKIKKHSNAKVMIRVLLGAIAVCMIFMIATGSWNPFKSNANDEKAVEIYETSKKTERNLYKDTTKEANTESSGDINYPNGFKVNDYGKETSDGCFKEIETASTVYDDIYGLNWRTFYMKNNDYANEKYNSLKSSALGESGYKKQFTVNDVTIYAFQSTIFYNFIIKDGSTVYETWGAPENISKYQKWFDYVGINFQTPNFK